MIRFYAPDIETTRTLPETESGHIARVLRKQAGDHIHVVDGKGHCFECVIVKAHHKATEVDIISRTDEPDTWPENITIAIAPTKNIDRMEWFVEKAVEMGVNRIVMLRCEHSERKTVNVERLEKIMVSAMKQSLKARLPELTGMTGLREFLESTEARQRFVGYCDSATERREFAREFGAGADVAVLIGPEGDFSPAEIKMAREFDFIPVTFGKARLRTETAALFAVAAIHTIDQLEGK